jgi:hypothetical protein
MAINSDFQIPDLQMRRERGVEVFPPIAGSGFGSPQGQQHRNVQRNCCYWLSGMGHDIDHSGNAQRGDDGRRYGKGEQRKQ